MADGVAQVTIGVQGTPLVEEVLLRTTADVLDRAIIVPGAVMGFVVPSLGMGDFSIVRGIAPDGTVTLASVTSRRKKVYMLDELEKIRPMIILRQLPRGVQAVENGSWYQDVRDGKLVQARDGKWLDEKGSAALMPIVPSLILRHTDSARVAPAAPPEDADAA